MSMEQMTEEEMEEIRRQQEEYVRRLVPPSDEEIIRLAEKLWTEPDLKPAFQRVGYSGDLTEDEEAAVHASIDAFRQGPMWDRDELHLALAPPLVRRFAAGMIERLDGEEAKKFLADRKVVRIGGGAAMPRETTEEDVMAVARAMKIDPGCWAVIMRLKDYPNSFPHEIDKENVLDRFVYRYQFKYGLFNRSGLSLAIGALRSLARMNITELDSEEAREIIRRQLIGFNA